MLKKTLLNDKKQHVQKVIALFIRFHKPLCACRCLMSFVLVVTFIMQNIDQPKNSHYYFKTLVLN